MTWFVTGIRSAHWYNQVMRTNLSEDEASTRIDETLALFSERGLPMLWSVSASDRPANLEKLLEDRGLTKTGTLVGMACELDGSFTNETSTLPAIDVERVRDAGGLQQWANAYIEGFEMPESAARPLHDVYAGAGFDDSAPFRHYVGLLEGTPVASSTLFLGAGIAGVWHVSTDPAARRRGIGMAMTRTPLADARAIGYRIGTLYASEMGVSVYSHLGFKEYTRMTQYQWRAEI